MSVHASEPEPHFDFDREYAQLATQMRDLHLSRIAEMPRIELYLDQLLSFVQMELSCLYASGEKIITGSMVNNYVKQRLLPAPRRRRYTRRHLASLMFVCVFKQVLSIAQIAQIEQMCLSADIDVEQAYDDLVGLLERSLADQFAEQADGEQELNNLHIELITTTATPVDREIGRVLESSVSLVARKVYLTQILLLEQKRAEQEGVASLPLWAAED